jgi:hypothetical protein
MSDDEKAAVIGRMVFESKSLIERGTALQDEIRRYAMGFGGIMARIQNQGSVYSKEQVPELTEADIELLKSYPTLIELLAEAEKIRNRYHELAGQLSRVGVSVQ